MLLRSVEPLSYGISAGGMRTRDLRAAEAARRSNRSNRRLHHRLPMAFWCMIYSENRCPVFRIMHRIGKRHAGERAISASVTSTRASLRRTRAVARGTLSSGRLHSA